MNTNHILRALRESRNLSLEEVAEEAKVSFRTVLRAEQGYPLNPGSRQRLCTFFGKTSEELGLVPQRRRARSDGTKEPQREQETSSLDISQVAMRGMLAAIQNLKNEGVDMNRSRRFFLQMLGTAGAARSAYPYLYQQTRPHDRGVSIDNRAFGLNHATVPVSTSFLD